MHEVVRRNWVGCGHDLRLMRSPTDDGVMLFAFRCGHAHPIWVAKRGAGQRGRLRMLGEKRALEWILPWHLPLRAPALLDSLETPGEVWVVQSGLRGVHRSVSTGSSGKLPAEILIAAEWLHRFQSMASAPVAADLRDLACSWARDAEARPDDWSGPLWQQVRSSHRSIPAVATHGDYWLGNFLFDQGRISVLDWNNFHSGNPLDDLLTLLMTTPRRRGYRYLDRMACFLQTFFSPGPARDLLHAWTQWNGLSAREARFCFYLFLVRRLRWEFGFGLQSRSQKTVGQAQRFWTSALTWLAEHDFPDPFHFIVTAT